MKINIYLMQEVLFYKTFGHFIIQLYELYNQQICIICNNNEQVELLDNLLWTFTQLSFVPHATTEDPVPFKHIPIILTNKRYIESRIPVFMSYMLAQKLIKQYERVFIVDNHLVKINNIKDLYLDKVQYHVYVQDEMGKWK